MKENNYYPFTISLFISGLLFIIGLLTVIPSVYLFESAFWHCFFPGIFIILSVLTIWTGPSILYRMGWR